MGTEPTTHIDDEYSRAGIMDPKIVITTSRDPSSKLLQFAKVGIWVWRSGTDGGIGDEARVSQLDANQPRELCGEGARRSMPCQRCDGLDCAARASRRSRWVWGGWAYKSDRLQTL